MSLTAAQVAAIGYDTLAFLQRIYDAGAGGLEIAWDGLERAFIRSMPVIWGPGGRVNLLWVLHREEQYDPNSRVTRDRYFAFLTPAGYIAIVATRP